MDSNMAQARDFFLAGVGHYEAGRLEDAERQFAASLALLPGRLSTLLNLGATRLKLGKFAQAEQLLSEALEQEPDNVEALGHRATALAEMGQAREALADVDRLVALDPSRGSAWSLKGTLLREQGRRDEAADAYRRAIASGADVELNGYYLAALEGGAAPRTPPAAYVQGLFDGYADGFEEHLVEVLNYRAPEILVARVAQMKRLFERALDLGCGTGLCGVKLRPLAAHIDGVDLSANMVDRARERGVYDQVHEADAAEYLRRSGERYDLIVAADVFIYVGALEAVFEGAARAITPGGVFCFSVEKEAQQEFALRASLRYAHSRGYIERLAAENGFDIVEIAEHPIREDQRAAIAGLFAWLVKR
ncbi:methyltransferase domain-containing protein [Caenimonas sp. SL110]|uniref:methyltransferase domain-containing protein n=1 Tax=Caenimonas sp. SL110 TaxID=1450524 RepID=UPI0013791904|nr:methyltransferase domain-containing protein [Caenimonas sp. SL110]